MRLLIEVVDLNKILARAGLRGSIRRSPFRRRIFAPDVYLSFQRGFMPNQSPEPTAVLPAVPLSRSRRESAVASFFVRRH